MIRTIHPLQRPNPGRGRVTKANGFSLRAGVNCEGHQRGKRDHPGGARFAGTLPVKGVDGVGEIGVFS